MIRVLDPPGSFLGSLVFPDAQNSPTQLAQETVRVPIAFDVPCNLSSPPISVGLRPRTMDRAVVPKAPIDENG